MINYIKKIIFLYVFTGFFLVYAGSYDDFFKAIEFNDASTVIGLIKKGMDANSPAPNRQPALIYAISQHSKNAAKALIQAQGIQINQLNLYGESALMLASLNGEPDLVEQLLKHGALVNQPGWTALHYASLKGHISIMRMLIENGAQIDAESPNETTPLMMAAYYGTPAAVKLLLEEGADPSMKNQQGLTALDMALKGPHAESSAYISAFLKAQQARESGY